VVLYRPPRVPFTAALPFNQDDWPQVTRLQWIPQADEGANAFFSHRLAPFNFDDGWPPPFAWRWQGSADIAQNFALRGAPLPPPPFVQTDWQLPPMWRSATQSDLIINLTLTLPEPGPGTNQKYRRRMHRRS